MSFLFQKKFILAIVAGLLAGCTVRVDQRGKLPEPEKLKQLRPHIDTKEDVLRLVGSPTTISTFDDRVWLYVHRTTETASFFEPKVVDQKQVILTFDEKGLLKSITSQADEKDLTPSKNVTPSAGFQPTWTQRIFGSYGRFAKKGKPD